MSKKLFAEFFGTFWLVFGGCGSAIFAASVNLGIGYVGVAFAFGLTVLTMAYAVGHISGGHFNPAVTLGLVAGGRFSAKDALPYIVSQVVGGVVAGAHVQGLPCRRIQIIDGMILLACKTEQPVARGKGGDVGLIHPADGEGAGNALVAALHGAGVLGVEGAALLVDHDAVLFQGVEAAAVELAGEQALAGIGGVHDDEVVLLLAAADVLEGVLKVDVHPAVIHAAGIAGQVGTAGFHHLRVHLHKVDALHPVVAGQLPHHAAVTGTDDKDVFCLLVHRHGHMHDHLVIDEFVALGQHHIAVQCEHPAKLRRFKNIDALVIALLGVELFVHPDAVLHVRGVKLGKPKFHLHSLLMPERSAARCPGPRGRSCCSPWPWRTRCSSKFPW